MSDANMRGPADSGSERTRPILEARRVRRRFGDLVAVGGVDVDLHAGAVTVVMGANGAGKSTLMRLLAGDMVPDSGVIRVGGVDLAAFPDEARARLIYVAQHPPLAPFLSLREHAGALLALRSLEAAPARAAFEDVAGRLGLTAALDRPARALSGGMAHKAALAMALIAGTDLVLLDEPHAGLDLESMLALRQLIHEARARGVAFLIASHLPEATLALADRVLVLRGGRLVLDLDSEALGLFGGDARAFEHRALVAMTGAPEPAHGGGRGSLAPAGDDADDAAEAQ